MAHRFCWGVGDTPDGGGGFSDLQRSLDGQCDADLEEAVDGVRYISEHMKTEDCDEGVRGYKNRAPIDSIKVSSIKNRK